MTKGTCGVHTSTRKSEKVGKHSMHAHVLDVTRGTADWLELTPQRRAKSPRKPT